MLGSACITVGVHQGSILGSLMFTIYVNDLPEALNEQNQLYAVGGILQAVRKSVVIVQDKLTTDVYVYSAVEWMKKSCFTVHLVK